MRQFPFHKPNLICPSCLADLVIYGYFHDRGVLTTERCCGTRWIIPIQYEGNATSGELPPPIEHGNQVTIDVNDAVAQAMQGQQAACEREDCCQNNLARDLLHYETLDQIPTEEISFPKILPPEDITLTPEQLELLSPYAVVAGPPVFEESQVQ